MRSEIDTIETWFTCHFVSLLSLPAQEDTLAVRRCLLAESLQQNLFHYRSLWNRAQLIYWPHPAYICLERSVSNHGEEGSAVL